VRIFTYLLTVSINRLKSIISVDYSITKIIKTCSPTKHIMKVAADVLLEGRKTSHLLTAITVQQLLHPTR